MEEWNTLRVYTTADNKERNCQERPPLRIILFHSYCNRADMDKNGVFNFYFLHLQWCHIFLTIKEHSPAQKKKIFFKEILVKEIDLWSNFIKHK